MILFFDTPALLATYVKCPQTSYLRALMAKEDGVAISAYLDLDLVAALKALEADGLADADAQRIMSAHLSARASYIVENAPYLSAAKLVARHGIGTSDAMHLAGALALGQRLLQALPSLPYAPVFFVSLNDALRAAARAEGLRTRPRG